LTNRTSIPEGSNGDTSSTELFVFRSLQASSEWLRFADPKLLGVLVLLGLGLSSLLGNAGALADAHRSGAFWGWASTLCFWVSLALAAITVLAVSLGLFPRLKTRDKHRSLFYFGGIAEFKTAADYGDAVQALGKAGAQRELVRQAWQVAVIAAVKHRWARRGYWCAVLFLTSWGAAMVGLKLS
jgi:hypothetical protein